jgi:hypothetical protein
MITGHPEKEPAIRVIDRRVRATRDKDLREDLMKEDRLRTEPVIRAIDL